MARVSRRHQAECAPIQKQESLYRVGIYARLSVEDNGSNSDSLEHQITYLEQYIASHPDMKKAAVFSDNGYSGTNFQRPAFHSMIESVRAGTINCILVKDLSRLGRNYIETGEFLERVCPFLKIRLVAVNDGYDTADNSSNGQLAASLSNIVNDFYARDISRKITSALRTKMENGDYIGNYAPYGYRKDSDNPSRLLIDEETAPVVRRIFALRASGMSYGGINRLLNEEGILSPSQRKREQGIKTNNNQKDKPILWNRHILTEMLHNTVYIGNLAQRKGSQCLYAGIPYHITKPEEWIVVPNTHEAIVDPDLFHTVQAINEATRQKAKASYGKYDALPKEKNLYGKKLVCADCGVRMKLHRSFSTKKDKVYFSFICPTFAEHNSLGCSCHAIKKETLDRAVLETVLTQIRAFLDVEQAVTLLVERDKGKEKIAEEAQKTRTLRQEERKLQSRLSELYIDWKDGLLDKDGYDMQRDRYSCQLESVRQQLAEYAKQEADLSSRSFSVKRWFEQIAQFSDATEISSALVDACVSTIRVHQDSSLSIELNYRDELEALLIRARKNGEATA